VNNGADGRKKKSNKKPKKNGVAGTRLNMVKREAVRWIIAGVILAIGLGPACSAAQSKAPLQAVKIVKTYAHDPQAFTQGLLYDGGFLYESTGREGSSSLRKVELETGGVVKLQRLAPVYFGEGLAIVGTKLIQLTWLNGKGFVYDKETFRLESDFSFAPEGWGFAFDGKRLILSDGTPELRFLDPVTFKETGRLRVTDGGEPVERLNELEVVRGEILANIWMKNVIARIDPATGRVKGWLDLDAIVRANRSYDTDAVLNGIAYDAKGDRLFVTGKLWSKLYEIRY
jgi:glutaminyl-peptide cyclotransferase